MLDAGFQLKMFWQLAYKIFWMRVSKLKMLWKSASSTLCTPVSKLEQLWKPTSMKYCTLVPKMWWNRIFQKILHAVFQTVINSEAGVRMITRRWFPLSHAFGNRRLHWNPTPVFNSFLNWKSVLGFNVDAGFQMNPGKESGVHIKVDTGFHIKWTPVSKWILTRKPAST